MYLKSRGGQQGWGYGLVGESAVRPVGVWFGWCPVSLSLFPASYGQPCVPCVRVVGGDGGGECMQGLGRCHLIAKKLSNVGFIKRTTV